MTLLGLFLDPSLACTGELVLDLPTWRIVEAGACVTEADLPAPVRRRNGKPRPIPMLVRVRDDARRGCELSYYVRQTLRIRPEIAVIAMEGQATGSQDVEAATKMARASQAVWDAIECERPDLLEARRVMLVSPFAAKEQATGRRVPGERGEDGKLTPGSGKAAVARAVRSHPKWGPKAWDVALATRTEQVREAAYDAGAVALCALEQPLVRAIVDEYARDCAPAQEGP